MLDDTFALEIMPQPLKALQLKTPTPQTEQMFEASFNSTLDRYRQMLAQVGTGRRTYRTTILTRVKYRVRGNIGSTMRRMAKWRHGLAKESFSGASRRFGPSFWNSYGHPDAPYTTKRKPKDWAKVQAELEQLKKAASAVVTREAD